MAGVAGPILAQAVTGEVSWLYALMMSGLALLAGLGVIGREDMAKLSAQVDLEKSRNELTKAKVELEKTRLEAGK